MKLNVLFTAVLIAGGFIVPGIAFGSGVVSDISFAALFIKVVSLISMMVLAGNALLILVYGKENN